MKVTVVGTGYVGLVTGAGLAEVSNDVLCIDVDSDKIAGLKKGIIPIHEPGLDDVVLRGIAAKTLSFSTDIKEGVAHGDVIFIAVGTPPDEDGSADMQYVTDVARSIGQHMTQHRTVVTKSTVPVGTSELVRETIQKELDKRGVDVTFDIVSNPEFLKEGAAIADFMKPDRIIIGTDNEHALKVMHELYAPFNRNHDRLIAMDIPSAELTKYTANAMLATKISFMNEIANLAEKLGADIENIRRGIGSDPRIGHHFIYPGCGYGGSCFPKDVKALYHTAQENDYDAQILRAVEDVNARQKERPLEKLLAAIGEDMTDKKIALWGLAFKPDTDDMREAPSRRIIDSLTKRGAHVHAYDPVAHEEAKRIYGDVDTFTVENEDVYAVLEDADALIIVTEWKVFRSPDMQKMKNMMRGNVVIDGRNVLDPTLMREQGFIYDSIGRPA